MSAGIPAKHKADVDSADNNKGVCRETTTFAGSQTPEKGGYVEIEIADVFRIEYIQFNLGRLSSRHHTKVAIGFSLDPALSWSIVPMINAVGPILHHLRVLVN